MKNDEYNYFITAILLPNLEHQIEIAKEKGIHLTVCRNSNGGLDVNPTNPIIDDNDEKMDKLKLILKTNPTLTKVRH